jgi:hypothetical protein
MFFVFLIWQLARSNVVKSCYPSVNPINQYQLITSPWQEKCFLTEYIFSGMYSFGIIAVIGLPFFCNNVWQQYIIKWIKCGAIPKKNIIGSPPNLTGICEHISMHAKKPHT